MRRFPAARLTPGAPPVDHDYRAEQPGEIEGAAVEQLPGHRLRRGSVRRGVELDERSAPGPAARRLPSSTAFARRSHLPLSTASGSCHDGKQGRHNPSAPGWPPRNLNATASQEPEPSPRHSLSPGPRYRTGSVPQAHPASATMRAAPAVRRQTPSEPAMAAHHEHLPWSRRRWSTVARASTTMHLRRCGARRPHRWGVTAGET